MIATASNLATTGESIVVAERVALRYLFVLGNENGPPADLPAGLDNVRIQIERSRVAAAYVDPLISFYEDVTIPFTTRRQLPIVALTEPSHKASMRPPVEIEIQTIETFWEERRVTVSPARIPAHFKDSVTFFDSGHVVYAPTFLLQSPWATDDASAAAAQDAMAQHISALTSLVSSAGVSHHRGLDSIRSKILFRFAGEADGQDFLTFINNRLAFLCDERSTENVFADLIRPALSSAGRADPRRAGKAYAGMPNLTWSDLRSASLEIVGAKRHDDIVRWCKDAKARDTTLGVGVRALAGLGQNVLDVHNQDEHEVADSLSQAVASDEDVLLVHPKLTVLYSRTSRSFERMCEKIGGCPYVMLTNVVLAYNEHLLDQNAGLIEQIMLAARGAKTASLNLHEARTRLFDNQVRHALPNIFRYPAERAMFDAIVAQRGLQQRTEGFDGFMRRFSELHEGARARDERNYNRRVNLLLLALGMFQLCGLFVALLGLDSLKTESLSGALDALRWVLWGAFAGSLAIGIGVAWGAFRPWPGGQRSAA